MKGKKTGGRVKRNSAGKDGGSVRIYHTPSQQALETYNSWSKKSENLDRAIINHGNQNEK